MGSTNRRRKRPTPPHRVMNHGGTPPGGSPGLVPLAAPHPGVFDGRPQQDHVARVGQVHELVEQDQADQQQCAGDRQQQGRVGDGGESGGIKQGQALMALR